MDIVHVAGIEVSPDLRDWLEADSRRIRALQLYLSDERPSVLSISKTIGYSRASITDVLDRCGVTRRSASDAQRIRMSRLSPEERRALASAAHDTVRTGGVDFHSAAVKQARAKQRTGSKIGAYEAEFAERIADLKPIQQAAVDVYNVDIMIGSLAVEIDSQLAIPHHVPKTVRRIENLLRRGMSTVYIRCSTDPPADGAEAYVRALFDRICSNPSTKPEHRMIRRDGQLLSAHRLDGDQLSCVFATHDRYR